MVKSKKPTKKHAESLTPFWSPGWSEFDRVFDNFKKDFEHAFTSFPTISMPSVPPMPKTSCDVLDEGKNYVVKMDVPGVKKNEINVNITENSVEVTANHKEEGEEKKKNFLRKERSHVSYYRTVPLPQKVVSNKSTAKLVDGVLNITIPKAKPTPKPTKKSISVQ